MRSFLAALRGQKTLWLACASGRKKRGDNMMRNESEKPIWNVHKKRSFLACRKTESFPCKFEEHFLDCELFERELSDQEIWERIYGRNAKPFDWRKSNIEVEGPLRGF
ncbi:MAG: hypothetical protein WA139_06105 [Candidatus Aenigmatarchaeota archaeon]